MRQLELIGPEVIVALGKFAAQTLLATKTPITRLRGHWYDYHGIQLMPTFHPAYLLRNPADKRLVWEDIQKVMRVARARRCAAEVTRRRARSRAAARAAASAAPTRAAPRPTLRAHRRRRQRSTPRSPTSSHEAIGARARRRRAGARDPARHAGRAAHVDARAS